MEFDEYIVLGIVAGITLALNLPFGFLRSKSSKYSFRWFLYIHLPVPFIYLLRRVLMFNLSAVPVLIIAAAIGQVWGGKINGSGAD